MAIDLNQLLSLLTTVGGGALSANAAGNTSSQLNSLLSSLQGGQLQPWNFSGPGGQSAGFNPSGGYQTGAGGYGGPNTGLPGNPGGPSFQTQDMKLNGNGSLTSIFPGGSGSPTGAATTLGQATGGAGGGAGVNLGSLNPAFNSLVNLGTNSINQAGGMNGQLPSGVSGVANNLSASGNPFNNLQQLTQGGFQPGLASTAFGGAQSQAAIAGQDPNAVYQRTLDAYRANAQPGNLLAANQLQDSLFGTGRLGTTGGGLLATAFGKGLGQADAGFQLQAQQAAQSYQQNALGLSQGLAGIGSGIAGLGENLTQGNFNRGQTLLGNQVNLSQLPGQLQQQQLSTGLQALSGQGALNSQGLGNFQAALQAAIAQANAKNQTASAQASLAGTRAQTPTSSDIWGQILGGIGSRLGDPNSPVSGAVSGVGKLLGGLFSGSGGGGSLSDLLGSANGALDSWNTAGSISNGLQDVNSGGIDWGSILGDGFKGASGQAADALSPVQTTVSKLPDVGGGSGTAQNLGGASAFSGSKLANTFSGDNTAAQTVKNVYGDAGALYGAYQGVQQGGAKGYATAANDVLGLAGYNIPALSYAGAVDKATHGDVPGAAVSAISTYLPVAGLGFAAAGALNHAFGGGATAQRNSAAWEQETGTQTFAAARNLPVTKLADGRVIDSKTAMDLSDKYWRVRFEGADPSLYYDALAKAKSMTGVNLNAKIIKNVDTSKGNVYGKLSGPG